MIKNSQWQKWEKTIGSLKFAVIIISLFTVAMIVGTFAESSGGADFASRLIYKTWWFMLIQCAMFMSIIYAVYLRLPARKNLYGFYTIHAGLITIGCGSFITYHSGVDGSVQLFPSTPTQEIVLNDDYLRIAYPESGRQFDYKLPYSAFDAGLSAKQGDIKLNKFIPFAETKIEWAPESPAPLNYGDRHSSSYLLYNDNFAENFVLSLHPEALDFESHLSMGPLSVYYLPSVISNCVAYDNPSKLIIWNSKTQSCTTPEAEKISIQETQTKKRFLVVKEGEEFYSFFPEFSPFPLTKDFNLIKNSYLRVFSKKLFEGKPTLFLFGKKVAFMEDDKWIVQPIKTGGDAVELPWMGFQVKLEKHEETKVPTKVPYGVWPKHKNGELTTGAIRAVELEVQGKKYWATNNSSLRLQLPDGEAKISMVKNRLKLPFELSLSNFKMDTDPGTKNPASYESFVRLFTGEEVSNHHIFMNNPLKYDGLTFYQASYFPIESGGFGSVLSANIDPGRWMKYLGSLLLVLGSAWHFWLRRRKTPSSSPEGAKA